MVYRKSKGKEIMNGLKISFAVVAFVIIQGVAVIWYVSKLDSRVDQMYKSFEEENKKEVIENQVKMKLDLENLIADVKTLQKEIKQMNKKDKEIVRQNKSIEKQHQDLFKFLEQNQGMNQQNEQKGGYSYD
jgi:ribosomal protein S15P/S13E